MNKIKPLLWDSEFFNISCGRIIIDNKFEGWDELRDEIKLYDFISIQNVDNDIGRNEKISELGKAFLADINIQFSKKIKKGSKNENCVLYSCKDISKKDFSFIEVKRDDFIYSKFECDSEFKKLNGYRVYKEWIKNALNDNNKFFLIYEDEHPKAFILFSIYGETARIELIKVNKEYQKNGVATKMIKCLEYILNNKNINYLNVGTQVNNIGAVNLYHKLGFKEISHNSVFHLWNK